MNFNFEECLKIILLAVPEVHRPKGGKILFKERVAFTLVSLLIFLIMSQLPIFGAQSSRADPFYHQRMILASNRGTVMELGIAPILTSGMVLQFLEGSNILKIPEKVRGNPLLMQGMRKLSCLALAFVQATAFVYSGMYGPISTLGAGNAMLIILQLFLASLIMMLLDEMMEKGYGIGSGISLFICTHICSEMVWKVLGPVGFGGQYVGILVAIPHLLLTRPNKLKALHEIFFRGGNLPNLSSLLSSILIWQIAAYFHGWRVELPLKSSRGERDSPNLKPLVIKLFYTSNMPIILFSAFVGNIHFISQSMYSAFPKSITVKLIGQWKAFDGYSDGSFPTYGLAYLVSPPRDIQACLADPAHTLFYLAFVIGACGFFAHLWLEMSNTGTRAVADSLRARCLTLRGRREISKGQRDTELERELERYIPTAAVLGGMLIGFITTLADVTNALGSGPGILIAISTISFYYDSIIEEVGSRPKLEMLAKMLGL